MKPHNLELEFWAKGLVFAGIDEAGRGALAGPVCAACVVLDPNNIPDGLADSKTLTPLQRSELALQIKQTAFAWSVALKDHEHIDNVNILQATFDAMILSVENMQKHVIPTKEESVFIDHLLIDGNRFRGCDVPHTCLIDGDALCVSIAAASILAKTERDAWMTENAHVRWPQYGFAQHKGYATLMHRNAIVLHGPCEIHRKTFLSKIIQPTLFDFDGEQ